MSKMKDKKVLVLASVASMIGQFNMPNIQLMQELGYEVHVVCNFKEGNTCDDSYIRELQKTLKKMYVKYHTFDCPRNVFNIQRCLKAYQQLWELTGRYRFSWIHCHSPAGGVLARLVAHFRKIPVIYTAHGFHFYCGAPWKNWLLYYSAEALLSYWTDVLITVNKEDYKTAKQMLKARKTYYIPGVGVDVGLLQKTEICGKEDFCRKYQIPIEAVILLSVGELSKRKNHLMVIDALAVLKRKDIYYMICGQGPMQEQLKRRAKQLGVWEQIRMTGFQKNVVEMYRNADIFVFPSVQEGMPVALIEAMAAGMPCVASDIRGNRELLSAGMLFSLKNPKQLIQILTDLLDRRQFLEECKKINQKKIRAYDQAVVQKRMLKIYRNMDSSL